MAGETRYLESASDLSGHCLQGRYQILRELARGGMGAVYLANDLRLQRRVVVKVPLAEMMGGAEVRQRFLSEVEHLSHHEHPHILGIQDFGEHEGLPYAVLQYLGGGDLQDRLRGGRQSPEQVQEWLPDIASALDAVHARGSVHRDVKPANILFDEQGHAYLSDFGITKTMHAASTATTRTMDPGMTRTGLFVGSAPYAPPEAIDREFSPLYDVYGLGVVVYEALSLALPIEGRTSESMLVAKQMEDPAPLPAEDVPRACANALMRALARDPASRFASCGDFARAFAAGVGAGTTADGGPRRGRRLLALGLGTAVSVALAGLLWYVGETGIERSGRVQQGPDGEESPSLEGGVFPSGSTPEERATSPREETVAILESIPDDPRVELRIWSSHGERREIPIGSDIAYHFASDRDGHLTLLHLDPHGMVTVLYPNALGEDARIRAGVEKRFPPARAVPPLGHEELFLVSTPFALGLGDLGLDPGRDGLAILEPEDGPELSRRLANTIASRGGATGVAVARLRQRVVPRSEGGP